MATIVISAVALTGCGASVAADDSPVTPLALARNGSSEPIPSMTPTTSQLPSVLPGLGPHTLAQIPGDTDQVLVVTGTGRTATTSIVVLYQRTPDGWQAGPAWPAHNGETGWTTHHRGNDLSTPIGVFTLTDAGGLQPDPGSKLPYHQGPGFSDSGTGFNGESLAHAFDYVIAVNYNRVAGKNPLDWTMPDGLQYGGHIWLHVDHGGPTHGCVSLPAQDMVTLLRTLDPALHPVIVMGDAASLSH